MRRRIEQPGLRELALDLDQHIAELTQKADARRLIGDEGAAAAICIDDPAQHDAVIPGRDAGLVEEAPRRVLRRQVEFGGNGRLLRAVAHEPRFRADTERQSQRIEQNRFAGASFAGQHAKPWAEGDIEPVDQHHIAYGKAEEHRPR